MDGVVTAVGPAAGTPVVGTELDLSGYLLLTAPAEPHAHLDKALSWDQIRPPMGDLGLAIASWRAHSYTMTTESIAERATAAVRMMLLNGTTAVRTHVDLLSGPQPMRGVEALVALREKLRGAMELQITALAAPDTPDETVYQAIDLGVDLVGGAPHLRPTRCATSTACWRLPKSVAWAPTSTPTRACTASRLSRTTPRPCRVGPPTASVRPGIACAKARWSQLTWPKR